MGSFVNVLVTCTQSKRRAVPAALRASRDDLGSPIAERCRDWAARLAVADEPVVSARALYGGDHWSVALDIESTADARQPVAMWVASAGYGLLSFDDEIKPYGATLRVGVDESVVASASEAPVWWAALEDCSRSHGRGGPRSLCELVSADASASLVVVASPDYLRALAPDLIAAVALMSDPTRCVVVAAGSTSRSPELDPLRVSFDARMRTVVGGAMGALNARVARFILAEIAGDTLDRKKAQAVLDRAAARLPRFRYPERSGQTDPEVVTFIRRELGANPKATKTGLLRQLREHGLACEQRRFGGLFNDVKSKHHG